MTSKKFVNIIESKEVGIELISSFRKWDLIYRTPDLSWNLQYIVCYTVKQLPADRAITVTRSITLIMWMHI